MNKNSQVVNVDFHGQSIIAIKNGEEIRVSVASICNNIGIQVEAQRKRIHRHPVLSKGESMMNFPSDGGYQEMLTLPLRLIPGWLMGIDANRVKSELRDAVIVHQEECFDVLANYFMQGEAINPRMQYSVNPGDKLSKDQADTLRKMLTEAAMKAHPTDTKKQGVMIRAGWSKLKAHFKVSYRDIPQIEFTEAVSIMARHAIDGEFIGKEDAAVDAKNEPKKIAPPVISEYLQLHINRKTHEIALGQYDAIRGIITEAVQGNLNCGATEAEAHDCVEAYGDSASEVIVMNKRDVFMLASQTTQLLNSAGQALETIHRLERHIGRNLYLRKEHGKRGMFGLPESLVESVISAAAERLAA